MPLAGLVKVEGSDFLLGAQAERTIDAIEIGTVTTGTHAAPTVRWAEFSYAFQTDLRVRFSENEIVLPPAPEAFDEIDWQAGKDARFSQPTIENDWNFLPIIPVYAWDDWDWSAERSLLYGKLREPEPFDFALPILPPFLSLDELSQVNAQAGLSSLVAVDEFVGVPTGAVAGLLFDERIELGGPTDREIAVSFFPKQGGSV